MKNSVDRRVFLFLLSISLVSVFCVLPYVFTVQSEMIKSSGVPILTLILAQSIQSLILFSIVIFLGLFFSRKTGFQQPLINSILHKGNFSEILKKVFKKSVLSGVVVAIIIFAVDIVFTNMGSGISTHQNYAPVWQKLLAAFYGGVAEEIIMRLFLMSFLVWIGMKISKLSKPRPIVVWTAIFIAATIFGLGHLPITSSITQVTPLIVLRAIILNGIAGVVFGYLFWKKGLESAMIAHFTADIFLLTLLPLIFS